MIAALPALDNRHVQHGTQFVGNHFPRTEDAAAHRPDRASHDRGNFLVAEPLDLAQPRVQEHTTAIGRFHHKHRAIGILAAGPEFLDLANEATEVLLHVDKVLPGQQRFAQLMEQLAALSPTAAQMETAHDEQGATTG